MRSDQGDTRYLHRGGWMHRERGYNGLSLINMTGPGGHSYAVVISAQGVPIGVGLNRAIDEIAEGVRTGATDTALGERCEIWASEPPFQERVYGGPMLTCISADGIRLWTGRAPPGTDAPRISVRAVSVERRTPEWSEFRFPRDVLDWAYWSTRFTFPPETARPAYEVRYPEHSIRVRGNLRYEGHANRFSLRSTEMRLHYAAPDAGGIGNFSINIGPQDPYPHPLTGGSEPLDRRPLRISGETCRWRRVDLNVRWGLVGVCVTEDGVKLAEATEYDDTAHQDRLSVATSFRRGAPNGALMLPPDSVFEPWIAALPH